ATKYVNEQLVDALKVKGDKNLAISWVSVQEALKSKPSGASKPREPKPPANPTEAYVERLAGLNLAYTLASEHQPEGLDENWIEQYEAKVTEATNSGQIAQL